MIQNFVINSRATGSIARKAKAGALIPFMNMDVPGESGRTAAPVRVGVVLMQSADTADSSCVIREDGRTVDYMLSRKEETTTFSFDQAVTLENRERVEPEILQPLAELTSCGYKGTLLIGGRHRTDQSGASIDDDIIKKVLKILFSQISKVEMDTFNTVSFVQFYPDDSTLDLLNPERRDLKPFHHPVLGCRAEGACEVSVCSAEEAYDLYLAGRRRLEGTAAPVSSRCSFMFSVDTEQRLPTDNNADAEFCRGRLQLVGLAGGAAKNDLRGVSPLVKVLDHVRLGTRASNRLLPFLLTDALTGNSRTSLLYCIPPQQGLLDNNEAPSALALAQSVRGLVTTATYGRWCPRVTERELRLQMQGLRTAMMSQGEHGEEHTYRFAELTKILQIVKDQSWEKRREMSDKITEGQPRKAKRCPSGDDPGADNREMSESVRRLQDQLRQEMASHTREGKGSVDQVQERVTRIQQLRESLHEEMKKTGFPAEERVSSPPLEHSGVVERRRQTKEDHEKLIQEELEKMEEELKEEKAEGVQRDLLVMARERRVLAVQMEALREEALQARRDLDDQHHLHQQELQHLREQSLKVFQVFYQVSEEQKRAMQGRYQTLLLEAVQDAVHLSAQNQQLQAENKMHRAALGELKDSLATGSDPKAEFPPPPQ